jgi:hypothetical protein
MAHIVTIDSERGVVQRKVAGVNRVVPIAWRDHPTWMMDTTLLRYVDRYGMTVLNRLQCNDLLPELEALRAFGDRELAEGIDELVEAATYCARNPHNYLVLRGE